MGYVWHYTVGSYFDRIMESGALLPEDELGTNAVVIQGMPGGVWFSTRQDFEPTALKLTTDQLSGKVVQLTFEESHEYHGPMLRFGVPEDSGFLINWTAFRKRCTCKSKIIRRMESAAIKQGGNVLHYRVCLGSIPVGDCAICVWSGNSWVQARNLEHASELVRPHSLKSRM